MLTSMFIMFFCLVLSSLLSAAETSITTLSKSYLLHKTQEGSKRAIMLSNMLHNPKFLITSLLIGNNIANILLTTIATTLFIHSFGEKYSFALSLALIFIILIFGEILPKTYAIAKANKLSFAIAPVVYFLLFTLKPITFIFLKINGFLLYILLPKKSRNNNEFDETVHNLRGAIEMFNRESESEEVVLQEKEMLHSVLDLNELKAQDIMNHRKNIVCIDINEDKNNIMEELINSPYTRIPFFQDNKDNIIGLINVKNVFKNFYKDPKNIDFKSLLSKPYFIPETTYIIDLLSYFKETQERLALVVDEYGTFMGIITLGDIVEEITGELKNKEQNNSNEFIYKNKDSYIVAGDLKIRDLNRKMNWELPDEEFTTIAGLILYETGKIPNVGNVFIFHSFKFEILEKKQHQLVKIKITPMNINE